jgi:hypothetical protein
MKKLLSSIFVFALGAASCHHQILAAQDKGQSKSESAKIAGTWKLSMDSPHGTIQGPLRVKQDGSKLTATYETEHMGSMSLTGTVDGTKVAFSMELPAGQPPFTFTGTVEGDKMSGTTAPGGSWTAARQ